MNDLWDYIIRIVSILAAISIHEFAHAYSAYKLGDHTARLEGRMTLNPLSHIDPIGIISFILVGFGWSKPVPIDPRNFQNPKVGTMIVSLAGPLSNIAALFCTIFIIKYTLHNVATFTFPFIIINSALALFNLIPVAPLDGFKIVSALLPNRLRYNWEALERYGPVILILLIIPFSPLYPIFNNYMSMGINLLTSILYN